MQSPNPKLWILEDHEGQQFVYRELLEESFELLFFDVLDSFKVAYGSCPNTLPDLIIADLRLPDGSFLEFAPQMQQAVPFIVVSSTDDLRILEQCYLRGAADYLTKPIGKSELIFKINRLLADSARPTTRGTSKNSTPHPLGLPEVFSDLDLTLKEIQIVAALLNGPGQALPRGQIIETVWKKLKVGSKTLDVHLVKLRRKLKKIGYEIVFEQPDLYRLQRQSDGDNSQ